MIRSHSIRFLLTLMGALTMVPKSSAQDIPAYTPAPESPGFRLPSVGGTLTYSASASESIAVGYNGNNQTNESTNISGNLAYLSSSRGSPFSLVYSGGYLFATSNQPGSFFHNLAASQVFVLGRWSGVASDSVSYLPNSPVSGLSGVPGLGDQGVSPVQVLQGDEGSLYSNYGPRVTNTVTGTLNRALTNRTSIFGSGSSSIIRFPGSDASGLETNQLSGTGGLSHNLSARSSFAASYSFSRSTYPEYNLTYDTQSFFVSATRQFTARLSSNASIGPQYSSTANSGSTLSVAASASLNYQLGKGGLGVSFSRGVNSGQGVTTTGTSNSVSANYSRSLGRYTGFSTNASYNQFSSLPLAVGPQTSTNSLGAGAQLSRSITRKISAYASYTLQHQTNANSTVAVNAFHGTTQTLGFGLTYSPMRPIVLGH